MAQGRFGPNEWLVDEIYQQYLTDRDSVDPAWWDFFADYSPADGSALKTAIEHATPPTTTNGSSPTVTAAPATAPATPAAPVPSAPTPTPTPTPTSDAVVLRG
ncbi:MAG: 2-oxoglutarate dehydrogenase E1 subunit family protein, partial [Candidatus Nanopelagicales bacterium]